MSFVESLANVGIGYGVAVATQLAVYPMFNLTVSIGENLSIALIFTCVRQIMGTVGHPSEASEGLTACAFLLAGIWLRLDLCLKARDLNLPDDTSGHQSAN
jgi:hypothetical protein